MADSVSSVPSPSPIAPSESGVGSIKSSVSAGVSGVAPETVEVVATVREKSESASEKKSENTNNTQPIVQKQDDGQTQGNQAQGNQNGKLLLDLINKLIDSISHFFASVKGDPEDEVFQIIDNFKKQRKDARDKWIAKNMKKS